jgi:hypothetical protein
MYDKEMDRVVFEIGFYQTVVSNSNRKGNIAWQGKMSDLKIVILTLIQIHIMDRTTFFLKKSHERIINP